MNAPLVTEQELIHAISQMNAALVNGDFAKDFAEFAADTRTFTRAEQLHMLQRMKHLARRQAFHANALVAFLSALEARATREFHRTEGGAS